MNLGTLVCCGALRVPLYDLEAARQLQSSTSPTRDDRQFPDRRPIHPRDDPIWIDYLEHGRRRAITFVVVATGLLLALLVLAVAVIAF